MSLTDEFADHCTARLDAIASLLTVKSAVATKRPTVTASMCRLPGATRASLPPAFFLFFGIFIGVLASRVACTCAEGKYGSLNVDLKQRGER